MGLDTTKNMDDHNMTLHKSFKQTLQFILCCCTYGGNRANPNTTKFVDPLCQDKDSMIKTWQKMTHQIDDVALRQTIMFSHANNEWITQCHAKNRDPIELQFDAHHPPHQLFLSLLDIKQTYQW